MQTATSETQIKFRYLSICVHHYTLRAPCPKGQGTVARQSVSDSFALSWGPRRRFVRVLHQFACDIFETTSAPNPSYRYFGCIGLSSSANGLAERHRHPRTASRVQRGRVRSFDPSSLSPRSRVQCPLAFATLTCAVCIGSGASSSGRCHAAPIRRVKVGILSPAACRRPQRAIFPGSWRDHLCLHRRRLAPSLLCCSCCMV